MNPSSTVDFFGSKKKILQSIKKVIKRYVKKMKVVPHPFEDYSAENISVVYGKGKKSLEEFLQENQNVIFRQECTLKVARAVCTNLEWPSFNDIITIKSYNHFSNHLHPYDSFSIHLIVRLHEPSRDSEGHECIILNELHRILRLNIKKSRKNKTNV